MPRTEKRKLGDAGEENAKMFVVKHGMKVIGTNYSKPWGEIDIIAKDADDVIRFIEVKTSKFFPNSSFDPEMRVSKGKISRLKKICETYISETGQPRDQEWQIDVISVILDKADKIKEINYIENAVFGNRY